MTKPEGSDHKYEVWLDLDDDPWDNGVSDIWDTLDSFKEAEQVFNDLRENKDYFDTTISIVDSAGDVLEEIGPRQILEASYAYRVEVDVQTIVEDAKIADENNDLQDLVDCPDGKIMYVTGNVHHEMDEIDDYVWQIRTEDGDELWAL